MSSDPTNRSTAARALLLLAISTFGAAIVAVCRGNELAATWFYDVAWWSYIVFVDALVYQRRGHSLLLSRPRAFVLLSIWSAAFWLFFEVINFRLQNWYYVGVPRDELSRTLGVFVSFATVLPGILETGDLLASRRVFERTRCRPRRISPRAPAWLFALGLGCLVLPLCFPRHAYPLIWGATVLLTEAWLVRRRAGGILGELALGRIGTLLRWLAAGLVCGILWETWNSFAAARGIYTVPFFEDAKLFEMPIAGFLGFPPFALECYSFARVLVELRLVPDWEAPVAADFEPYGPTRYRLGAAAAVAFTIPAVVGVNVLTVRSTRPMVDEIPGVTAAFVDHCERAGIRSTAELEAASRKNEIATLLAGIDADQRLRILASARLMEVRGLGARGARALRAAGVFTIDDLARSDPDALYRRLIEDAVTPSPRPTPAEVRVWVRGARLEG